MSMLLVFHFYVTVNPFYVKYLVKNDFFMATYNFCSVKTADFCEKVACVQLLGITFSNRLK
jgi:hypothetical protein